MKTITEKIRHFSVLAIGASVLSLAACTTESTPTPDPTPGIDTSFIAASILRDTGAVKFQNCSGCHGTNGEGSHGPPLANSDYFMNNRQIVINLVIRGNQTSPPYIDSVVVNGLTYQGGGMPNHDFLSDFELASILTYLRSVKNDSTVTGCAGDPPVCTKVARDPAVMLADTVAVWEVEAVRDSLITKGVITPTSM